jgi:hypothetical protein
MRSHLRKYNQTKPKVHMLVARTLANTDMEIQERSAINAFTHGVATKKHFDLLTLMMNLLLVAGQTHKSRKHALDYAQKQIQPVLRSIKDRFHKSDRFGVSGTELKTLKQFIEFNREFWLRQPSELYVFANEQVESFYQELYKNANS